MENEKTKEELNAFSEGANWALTNVDALEDVLWRLAQYTHLESLKPRDTLRDLAYAAKEALNKFGSVPKQTKEGKK